MSYRKPAWSYISAYLKPTLMVLLCAVVLAACAAGDGARTYTKDGKVYGTTSGTFRHRWWNYYERATSYLEGDYNEDAARDLLAALRMRDTDGRRARTYGMHFSDYFPHRELGIAYLGMDRPEDAVRELETSLTQEETAKAKFYLNKAREAVLVKQQAAVPGPAISIGSGSGVLTNSLYYKLTGKADGEGFISSVRINGKELFNELASKEVPFDRTIQLSEGENVVTVEASDLLGKTAVSKTVITADRIGPVIDMGSFDGRRITVGGDLTVTGSAYDVSGIVALTVNGKDVETNGRKDAAFSVPVSIKPGSDITVAATDRAGNTTKAVLESEPALASPSPFGGGVKNRGLYASLDDKLALSAEPPVIKLKDLSDRQDVFHDTLFVDGQVSGENDITSLVVNGQQIISKKGRKLFFNFLTALDKGDNVIVFKAEDSSGATANKKIHVNRLPQIARSIDARLSISAIPFKSNKDSFLAEPAYDSFVDALTTQGRFKMVERAMLDEVLQEQALSMEDIVDPATAARFGKIIAAECVLIGKYYETDKSVEIYARLVDTETAEILESHDVYGEEKNLKGISKLMEGLAIKFKNSFPLVEGLVLKVDGDKVIVDIGRNKGVTKNSLIVIFREGERLIHPVTGKDLGAPTTVLGKAKLYDIYDDMAMAELVNTDKAGDIKPMDEAITK